MIETTWSVGLPSLSAATQVPASFLSFSSAALLGSDGNLVVDFSSARIIGERDRKNPDSTSTRSIVAPPHGYGVDPLSANEHHTLTMKSNGGAGNRQSGTDFWIFLSEG